MGLEVLPGLCTSAALRSEPPLLLTAHLCPQHEQALAVAVEPEPRWQLRAQIRKNITETLVSLRVHTVDDIQQVAAALAQCTVGGPWASPPST